MSSRKSKPQWWQLYVALPLLAGLFVLEIRLGLQGAENVIAQLGILFLIYMFMQVWIRANRGALMHLDEEQGQWQFKVYDLTAADLARARAAAERVEKRPLIHLPDGELKGVLSTTFEMDDVEPDSAFPVGPEILQPEPVMNVRQTKDVDA